MPDAMGNAAEHPLGAARGYNPAFFARAAERRAETRRAEMAARAHAEAEASTGYKHLAAAVPAADLPSQPMVVDTPEKGLSLDQCAVIYLVGLHGGAYGGPGCSLSETALAELAAASRATVSRIIASLVVGGFVVSARPSIREDRMRRLTDAGQAVFETLAGEGEAGEDKT